MSIFAELTDNGLSSCSRVVVVNSRKWGHFGASGCGLVRSWLGGGIGPKSLDKSVPCQSHKQTGPIPLLTYDHGCIGAAKHSLSALYYLLDGINWFFIWLSPSFHVFYPTRDEIQQEAKDIIESTRDLLQETCSCDLCSCTLCLRHTTYAIRNTN